jgi:hypothetical protein
VTNCDSVNEMTDFFMETIRACSTETLEQMVSNMNHHRHLSDDAGSFDRVAETAANTVAVLVTYERGDPNPRVNQLIREREKCRVYNRLLRSRREEPMLGQQQQHVLSVEMSDELFLDVHRQHLLRLRYR